MDKKDNNNNPLSIVKTKEGEIVLPDLIDIITRLTVKNREQFADTVKIIMKALEEKDPYTQGHSIRVAKYTLSIGEAKGFEQDQMKELELASILHDIGKLGIPDKILKKPGRLTKLEYEIMQQHSVRGERILDGISSLKHLKKYIRHHHERFDGYGYPDGLKGKQIPLISRIILVADTFDAMTSTRSYRKSFPLDATLEELMRSSGSQLDPELVDIFIESFREKKKRKAG